MWHVGASICGLGQGRTPLLIDLNFSDKRAETAAALI